MCWSWQLLSSRLPQRDPPPRHLWVQGSPAMCLLRTPKPDWHLQKDAFVFVYVCVRDDSILVVQNCPMGYCGCLVSLALSGCPQGCRVQKVFRSNISLAKSGSGPRPSGRDSWGAHPPQYVRGTGCGAGCKSCRANEKPGSRAALDRPWGSARKSL